jgi:hypothetical protein
MDGKALEGAQVTFLPETGTGLSASALTDKDGKFKLTTRNTGDGAEPGTYMVTVTKSSAAQSAADSMANMSPQERQAQMTGQAMKGVDAQGHSAYKSKEKSDAVPAKYKQPSSSGLKYTIPFQGEIKIDLSSK